ncbi:MAG: ribose transport system permease protein RbsC [Clostridia bacterium]|jgi:ribose/xylose/arabinose/galactoside ABC-type transport system permease subunit/ABC-type sugar transport system substrate-binding protein|nr:ribose transport system permease protein RbsC [Clostridia bacterium]
MKNNKGLNFKFKVTYQTVLFIILIALVLVFNNLSEGVLLKPNVLFGLTENVMETGLMALAMTFIIVTGGIDLSVGFIMAFSAIVLGQVYELSGSMPLAIAGCFLAGAMCGSLNGIIIAKTNISPLVTTLATFSLFTGLAKIVAGTKIFSNFPKGMAFLVKHKLFSVIPYQFVLFLVLAVIFWYVFNRTELGRYLRAMGHNEAVVHFSGIRVDKIKFGIYVLSGLMASLAAIVYLCRLPAAKPDIGININLETITAVVLGGTSIVGGIGSMSGTVIAVLVLAVLRKGLSLIGIGGDRYNFILGIILVICLIVLSFINGQAKIKKGKKKAKQESQNHISGGKIMKKFMSMFLSAMLILSTVGCGTSTKPAAENKEAAAEAPAAETKSEEAPAAEKKDIKIGMIPKFTGVDYFIACENGAKKAAEDLGVTLDWQGDPSGQESAAKQQAFIQTFIDKEYDAILVSALDAQSYADTLKQAMDKGIKVITWDADVVPEARDAFINQATEVGLGTTLMKGMAQDCPEGGTIAVVSSDPNSSNQNAWIAAIQAEYESKKDTDYKNFKFYENIIYAGNNQSEADTKVNTLMTQVSDLAGVFALSSMAGPAVAKACKDLNKPAGSVAIQSVAVPVSAKADMESGLIKSVVLWQPYDLGYLAVNYATDLINGNVKLGDKTYTSKLSGASKLGDEMYEPAHEILDNNVVILGAPIIYTLDSVDKFKGYPDATSGLN